MAEIVYNLPSGEETSISFDATTRETFTDTALVTESPVEDGANVADHVRPELPRFSFEATVSNTPTIVPQSNLDGISGGTRPLDLSTRDRQLPTASVLQFDDFLPRVRSVYETLRDLETNGTVFRLITTIREYENLVIESIEIVKDKPEDAIELVVGVKGVRIVESQTVTVPEEPRGHRTANRGTQQAQAADPAPSESLWHRASHAAGLL